MSSEWWRIVDGEELLVAEAAVQRVFASGSVCDRPIAPRLAERMILYAVEGFNGNSRARAHHEALARAMERYEETEVLVCAHIGGVEKPVLSRAEGANIVVDLPAALRLWEHPSWIDDDESVPGQVNLNLDSFPKQTAMLSLAGTWATISYFGEFCIFAAEDRAFLDAYLEQNPAAADYFTNCLKDNNYALSEAEESSPDKLDSIDSAAIAVVSHVYGAEAAKRLVKAESSEPLPLGRAALFVFKLLGLATVIAAITLWRKLTSMWRSK